MHSNESQRCHFLTFDADKIDQVRSVYIFTASLDAILILPTTLLNILLIISLYRSSEIRKPSTKLLFSLAMSDVLVGLITEPTFLVKKIAEFSHNFAVYCKSGGITYVIGGALGCVSFFTHTVIAIDRYLVVHKGTKYPFLVTNTRVLLITLAIWVATFALYTAQLYSPRSLYFKVVAAVMVTSVSMAAACYIKCFFTLRNKKKLIETLSEETDKQRARNIYSYKKSMYTMAYVFVAFNLCYLPFFCTSVSAWIVGESGAIWGAESISSVIIYSNSFINPVILFWRMKEIRKAVAVTIASAQSNVKPSHNTSPQNTKETMKNTETKV